MSKGSGQGILGATSYLTLAQLAPLVVNLVLTPFIILNLGRQAYGLWLVATAFIFFVGQVDGGIGRSVLRYFSRFAGAGGDLGRRDAGRYTRTLTLLVFGLCTLFLLPLFFLAGTIVDFFHAPPELRDGMLVFLRVSLVTIAVALWRNVLTAILNAHRFYALTSITHLASYAAYAISAFVTLRAGLGLYGMAIAAGLQALVATVVIVPAAMRLVTLRGVGGMTRAEIREFFSVAWKLQISGLLSSLSLQGATLIVGRAAPRQMPDFGPGATFAQQLRLLPMNAVRPIQSSLGATIGREGSDAGRASFVRLQRVWVILITGWVAVGAPASLYGVTTWLPLESQFAGQVSAVLLVSHLLALLPAVLSQWSMLEGHPEPQMWAAIVLTVLALTFASAVVGIWGAMGVTVGMLVAQLIAFVVQVTLAARRGILPRNPVLDIPWLPALVCSAGTFPTTRAIAHALWGGPLEGPVGLVLVGLGAAPFLAIYLVWTIGPKRTWRILRTRSLR